MTQCACNTKSERSPRIASISKMSSIFSSVQIDESDPKYRVDKKYSTASVHYQNKKFFGNPF